MQCWRRAFLLLPILFVSVACSLVQGGTINDEVAPTAAATAPPTIAVPLTITQSPGVPPQEIDNRMLRLWIPPEIGARTEAGAQELISQVRAFRTGQGDLGVAIEQKPIEGAGGILNYLQTGRIVAAGIMPDIVAVPTSLLMDGRSRDLFFPMTDLADQTYIDGVFPAPAEQAINGQQILGYPFATTGLTHLNFNPEVITQTVPLLWTSFISDTNHTLVFPADSREGAMLGLQFYLAEGGTLVDGAGRPALVAEPLARALTILSTHKANLLQSHQLKTLDEAWQYHQLGLSDFIWMRSDYLLERQLLDPTLINSQGYMPVPGVDGPLIPLTTSWAWALTTNDPTRQSMAMELISYLTSPENLANWSSRSQVLPAHRQAIDLMSAQNDYLEFAAEQMELARPMPISETSRIMDVLGDAVFQVLTTEVSPVLIAEQAVTALRQ